jgi:hypothetical protein
LTNQKKQKETTKKPKAGENVIVATKKQLTTKSLIQKNLDTKKPAIKTRKNAAKKSSTQQ